MFLHPSDGVPNGLGSDVCGSPGELGLGDDPGLEATAEQVPATPVTEIEPLCMAAVQVLHPAREHRSRRFDDEVVVRRRERERDDAPAVAVSALLDEVDERLDVAAVAEDHRPIDAARRDVEGSVGQGRAQRAGHCTDGSQAMRDPKARRAKSHAFVTKGQTRRV